MSNPSLFSRRPRQFPTLPRGEVVAHFETYLEAQAAVDTLSKRDFPVSQVSIVGSGLKTVERVTGRLTYAKAAGTGALSGAWFGLFIGLLLYLFSGDSSSLLFVGAAVLIGAGFGMIFSIVTYTLGRRRRDFTSIHQVLASSYDVLVEPSQLIRAREILGLAG